MSEIKELLPCPFCGNERILDFAEESNGVTWFWFVCGKCLCDLAKRTSKEKAIQDWNTRTESARIEELEKELADEIKNGDVMEKAIFGNPGWQSAFIEQKKRIEELERVLKEVSDVTRDWDCSGCENAAEIIDLGLKAKEVL